MIVTITMNPAVDKSTSVEKMMPEKKLRCDEMVIEAGGGGINVSKAIHKLGGKSIAIFPSGGMNGTIIENYLASNQIAFRAIPIREETRENFGVREISTNAQYRFVMPGTLLSQKEADYCFGLIEQMETKPTIIVASGSLPPGLPENFYAQLAILARKLDAKYILDTSDRPLSLALVEGIFLLKPNLSELAKLAGKDVLQLNEVDDAAMEIIQKNECEVIVVTLGPSGALLVTKDGYEHVPAPAVKKLSTVGAGDSTVAGMAWMLSQGKSLSEMVRFGVACGTAATMNPGTRLFDAADVYKLYGWINQHSDKYKLSLD